MALTKVKLIADGTIVQSNLHASHGITTADIGENASYLYYTDGRVSSYLSSNGYATQTDIVAAITDSAPATLDTLNELAAALGDDANFSTTVTNSIALKAPLASPSFTGNATFAGSVTANAYLMSNGSLTNGSFWGTTLNAGTGSYADFALLDSGTTRIMHVPTGTRNVVFESSVGIGTISPDEKLDVENGNIRLKSNSDGSNGILKLYDAAGTESGQIYPAAGDLKFYTPNDIIMSPTGNVGIGTTSPSQKLEVSGVIKSISTGAAQLILNGDTNNSGDTGQVDSIIDFLGDGNPGIYGYRINTENWSGQTALHFQEYINGAYTSRLYINKDGKVGIGATSPDKRLTVGGVNATEGINLKTKSGSNVWTIWSVEQYFSQEGYMRLFYDNVSKIQFRADGDSFFNGGDVGIGTTTPSYKLDVNGTTRATSSYHQNVNFTNTPTFQIGTDAFSSGFFVYDSTAAAYRMVVKSSTGNVGIGTVTPQTKLDVNGGVKAQTVEYSWHKSNPITSTDSYRHYKTTLYGGSGGNTMHIMGGFTLKAYSYSSNGYGEGSVMFHNWAGTFYNASVTNRGAWSNFVRSPYMSSDGYVVIVCEHNTYSQPIIDFYQFYTPYGWRSVSVSGDTTSNSLTGAY